MIDLIEGKLSVCLHEMIGAGGGGTANYGTYIR